MKNVGIRDEKMLGSGMKNVGIRDEKMLGSWMKKCWDPG
jgi:hypothetical protein